MDKTVDTNQDNFAGLDEDTYNKLVGALIDEQPMSEEDAGDFCDGLFDVEDDDDDSIEDA